MDSLNVDELSDLASLAKLFKCEELETAVSNKQNDEDFLNPSIGTYLNDITGHVLKENYFNQPKFADVIFSVEGQKVYGHKAIVSARCNVMSAMFSDHFMEGMTGNTEVVIHETTLEVFLAVLEYVYTDHAPIEDGDAVGILILADQFGLTRLVSLCELYITLAVDRSVSKNIEKSDINVIGLLLNSQLYNAGQLERWCLHFISSNYIAFSRRPEFAQLTGSNLEFIETNRWPPLSYLVAVEQYEKEMKKHGKNCCVM
jgi:Rho family protein